MNPTLIIAEAGVNHNGSLDKALTLVDAASAAGADIVKFQTFRAEAEISRYAENAEYQKQTTKAAESQLDMVKQLELGLEAHRIIAARCREREIRFLSTPFDEPSVDLLVDEMDMPIIKISSGDITSGPLLLKIARTGLPVILSTGMSTLGDIEAALGVLAFGYLEMTAAPSLVRFEAAYQSATGRSVLGERVTLLHCTTEYPAPIAEVNLRAMATLRHAFGLPVGYSDHTEGIAIPIAAVALGATVIEKHFTLDRNLPGPDHKASLEPDQLAAMVTAIRQVERALGNGLKIPSKSERKNRPIARKSLVASCAIRIGEMFSEDNLTEKRPGNGVSPMDYWSYLGTAATRDYGEDETL